jgi:hypothetical protein
MDLCPHVVPYYGRPQYGSTAHGRQPAGPSTTHPTMASPRPRGKEKGRRRPKTPYVARCAKPKPGGIESSAAAGSADKLGRSFSVNGKGVRVAMVLHRLWQFGFSSRRGRTECWIACCCLCSASAWQPARYDMDMPAHWLWSWLPYPLFDSITIPLAITTTWPQTKALLPVGLKIICHSQRFF